MCINIPPFIAERGNNRLNLFNFIPLISYHAKLPLASAVLRRAVLEDIVMISEDPLEVVEVHLGIVLHKNGDEAELLYVLGRDLFLCDLHVPVEEFRMLGSPEDKTCFGLVVLCLNVSYKCVGGKHVVALCLFKSNILELILMLVGDAL